MRSTADFFKQKEATSIMIKNSSAFVMKKLEELVPASGNLGTSRIANHLHNPSFVTERVHDGITADETSPCTALILAYGFDEGSVMIDHTAR